MADSGETGTWTPPGPIDLSNQGDSLTLIFVPDSDPTLSDTVIVLIDAIPVMGDIVDLDICADDANPIVDLVELFNINPENVLNVLAFGEGFDTEDELRNIDVSTFPIGPDVITFFPVPNGDCLGEPVTVNINLDFADLGEDNTLEICEGDFNFFNFEELISSENDQGIWQDINNSGVDLFFPDGVTLDQLDPGIYQYLFIIDGMSICGDRCASHC